VCRSIDERRQQGGAESANLATVGLLHHVTGWRPCNAELVAHPACFFLTNATIWPDKFKSIVTKWRHAQALIALAIRCCAELCWMAPIGHQNWIRDSVRTEESWSPFAADPGFLSAGDKTKLCCKDGLPITFTARAAVGGSLSLMWQGQAHQRNTSVQHLNALQVKSFSTVRNQETARRWPKPPAP